VRTKVSGRCAHCGLDAGPDPRVVAGKTFCCAGCAAVYSILHDEGLDRFYDAGGVGSLSARAARDAEPDRGPAFPRLDTLEAAGEADLDVVGMRCASCAWLIEHYLGRREGVTDVRVSYAASTCALRWDRDRTSLSHLLAELRRIGYRARPSERRLSAVQDDREARRLVLRTGICAFLTMNVMFAAVALYAGEFQGIGAGVRGSLRLVSALLATPVVAYGGWPFLRGAVNALRARRATMDTLIALGATTAFGVSLYGLDTGGLVFFDTTAMIVTLILAGRLVEHAIRRRGTRAIRNLLALEPEVARVVTPDGSATVSTVDVAVGQVVEVRPGERIPLDGVVTGGASSVDESLLTGEPAPRDVAAGSEVVGGSLNGWGVLTVSVLRVGAETAVGRIARAVQHAMEAKAPIQRLADRAMGWFVPAVLAAGVVAAAGWALGGAGLQRALLVGVAVVVIACPCALGLATPAAWAVAVGEAAGRGIFFRGGVALERAASVERVAFDKTGTLTDGALAIVSVHAQAPWTRDTILEVAAAAEAGSEHFFARAIAREARARSVQLRPAEAFRAHAGGGVGATVGGRRVLVGSLRFLAERGVAVPEAGGGEAVGPGATAAWVAVDGRYTGSIEAGDRLRPEAASTVARLAAMGIGSSLLTGDRPAAALRVALAAGIDPGDVHADLTPEEKASVVARLRPGARAVAMVGDGVNDAPALAAADVGIALGTGADVTLEAADVALTASDLGAVPVALAMARRSRRIVRQNLGWAIAYNVVAIPLAAAGVLHPIVAAGAMALSSVSVLANSLRLRRSA
jgi:Cu2+-exporting ATPase